MLNHETTGEGSDPPLHAIGPSNMQSIARNFEKIAFVASDVPEAQEARERLAKAYGNVEPRKAEAIVALGGDGLMLQTLHRHLNDRVPIYGMNRGSVGFLMNDYSEDDLRGRLARAEVNVIHPLAMRAVDAEGREHEALAINEVSLFRQIYQAAKIKISIDGRVRLDELICDGVLVATPAGSTAYNLSAHGPILPINAPLLALTPISPFRPRRWRGALLPNVAKIRFEVLEPDKRPVSAVADHAETRSVTRVDVDAGEPHRPLHDVRPRPQPGRAHPVGAVPVLMALRRSGSLRVLEDHRRPLLADHDRGRVGVAADHLRHDRGVHHPEAADAMHPQPRIDHGVGSMPHAARADGMEIGDAPVAQILDQRLVGCHGRSRLHLRRRCRA